MSRDLSPAPPIIQRFLNDLKLSGRKSRTQQSYCRNLRKFAEFLNHSPDLATEDQLRDYLLFLTDTSDSNPAPSTSLSKLLNSSSKSPAHATGKFSSSPAFSHNKKSPPSSPSVKSIRSSSSSRSLRCDASLPPSIAWVYDSTKLSTSKSPISMPNAWWSTSIVARVLKIDSSHSPILI